MDSNSCATSRREACMESMQSIVWNQCKALYVIRCKTVWNQAAENAPSVIPCAYGDTIHADA